MINVSEQREILNHNLNSIEEINEVIDSLTLVVVSMQARRKELAQEVQNIIYDAEHAIPPLTSAQWRELVNDLESDIGRAIRYIFG